LLALESRGGLGTIVETQVAPGHGVPGNKTDETAMDDDKDRPLTVALLAVPANTASTLFGLYDLLLSARREWQSLMFQRDVPAPLRPLVVSRDGKPLRTANGVSISPDASFATLPHPDVVVMTDLWISPDEPLDDRFDVEAAWVREQHARGATVASSCSGSVLLARTGLLDGLDATSHWAYCRGLERQYPTTRWHPDRALVVTGEGQRILMAGSGASWHALALFLIARFVGVEEAMQTARINVLDWNPSGPIAYASLARNAQIADPLIARCQSWAADNYAAESPVNAMAALSGLPERTFQRRFTQATGMAPLEYVHTLRLEEAKQMLEAGSESIDAIAADVGYQDASFFTRLFKRKVGLSPAQYRRRFGSLKRRLSGAGEGRQDAAATAAIG
jgi:transcriptional regulator GlxA family with amidase domain